MWKICLCSCWQKSKIILPQKQCDRVPAKECIAGWFVSGTATGMHPPIQPQQSLAISHSGLHGWSHKNRMVPLWIGCSFSSALHNAVKLRLQKENKLQGTANDTRGYDRAALSPSLVKDCLISSVSTVTFAANVSLNCRLKSLEQ